MSEPNGWMKMRCPRHDDNDPSLRIAPDGSYWKCMVCKKGGTPIHLEQWISRCDFVTAVQAVMDGDTGDPLISYHLQNGGGRGEINLVPRMLACGMRYNLLTRADVDDILTSDCPGTVLGMLLEVGP